MKVIGALDSMNGITIHSYSPSLVLKAVFHSSPSRIWIWCYPLRKSILLKYLALDSTPIMSSKSGIGNRYLILILLIALIFVHVLHVLSFFRVNNAGTTHGLMISLTTPFFISYVTCRLSSTCHVGLIL